MKDIISQLYQTSNEMEQSQLRSILLFSEFGKTHNRTDMMPKAVLSIIIKDKGGATLDDIIRQFGPCYNNFETNKSEIENAVTKLIELGLIGEIEKGKYAALTETDREKAECFFTELEKKTNILIDNIVKKYEELRRCKENNQQLLRKNITKALSLYLKLSGLDAVMNDSEAGYQPISRATEIILDKMDAVSGKVLVDAIGQVISNPTPEDIEILNIWSRAYVLTQIMKMDPTLSDFKATKIRNKTFVLDTDVVLNILATHAKYSQVYRSIIKSLADLGCKIIIPNEVIKEVDGHVKQAINIFRSTGQKQLDNYPDFLLEGPKSNVFIEDYVKLRRKEPQKKGMPFMVYIGNIYNEKDKNVLKGRLEPIIGKNVNNTIELVELDGKLYEDFKNKLTEEAADTAKGAERRYDTNKSLSEDDARLFLTLTKKNETLESEKECGLLKYKCYFLTQSRRTIRVAQELGIYKYDIICHPNALGIVLTEIGTIPQNQINIFNLFENPFVAYTATSVWDRIEPIIKAGVHISFMEIQQLRSDVEQTFDELLLSNDPNERIELSRQYREKGYPFMEQLVELSDINSSLTEENEALKVQNKELSEKLEEEKKKAYYKGNKQRKSIKLDAKGIRTLLNNK